MKKQYGFCRTALLLCAWLFSTAVWADNFVVDGIYYNITSSEYKTVEVTGTPDRSYSGDITIPATVMYGGTKYRVTAIGDHAFARCTGLMSVTISVGVTTIGDFAFYWCENLTSVTIPNGVTIIGKNAFYGCYGLTSVTIPNSVITIDEYAFSCCKFLKSVTIGTGVTTIGVNAFSESGLTSVTIPNSVATIDDHAFSYCKGLKSAIIGTGVTTIGESAFAYCSNLERFEGKIATNDYRCLVINDTLMAFAPKDLTEYNIPDGVTTIGERAFAYCENLTSVTIPNSVTAIGDWAFSDCTGLTSITIPESVTSIGNYAFSSCYGLTEITIPESVTSIGSSAFSWCSGLTSVTAYNPIPVDIVETGKYTNSAFEDVYANCILYVPAQSLGMYQVAKGWCEFDTILPIDESSAITEIQQENADGHVTVYNLQGVPVFETDDAADLRKLSAGFYIVNGKKMIIAR